MVKRLMSVATLALVVLVALAACGTDDDEEGAHATVTRVPNPPNAPVIGSPTADAGGGGQAATEVDLELVDTEFVPPSFTIAPNTDVVVHLSNAGVAPHTFTVEDLGIDEELAPGETRDVTINTEPGEFEYICTVPGHAAAGMVGTITVAEPGAVPAGTPVPEGSPSPVSSPPQGEGPAEEEPAEEAPASEAIVVELVDIEFVPPDITVPANTPTTITLTNTGVSPHTFTVEALDIDEELQAGESRDIEIDADAGTYDLICAIPGHAQAGMVGTVVVQ